MKKERQESYCRGLSILTQNDYFFLKFCHMSCSHSLRHTCIPLGNYTPTHVKMKQITHCNILKVSREHVGLVESFAPLLTIYNVQGVFKCVLDNPIIQLNSQRHPKRGITQDVNLTCQSLHPRGKMGTSL